MLHGGLRVEESVYGVPPAACRGLGEKSALAREKKAETSFIRRVRLYDDHALRQLRDRRRAPRHHGSRALCGWARRILRNEQLPSIFAVVLPLLHGRFRTQAWAGGAGFAKLRRSEAPPPNNGRAGLIRFVTSALIFDHL
jgi:hypothetical protein